VKIIKYTSYFHDGGMIDIQYEKNNSEMVFSMESAEIGSEIVVDDIPLSEYRTIKGKLHLVGFKNVKVDDKIVSGVMKMKYDAGDIFYFKIEKNEVTLQIAWENFPPKPETNDFSEFKIEYEDLYWENIPDLYDPFF